MNADLVLWYAARIAALTAFAVLALSLLSGMAIRTAFLGAFARNRSLLALHSFTAWLWIPLIAVHLTALLLDSAAKIGVLDLLVPFQSTIPGGSLAVGLGTISFLLLVFIGVTSALRGRMSQALWLWLHRLTYVMFAMIFAHAQLAGSDFSRSAISTTAWAVMGMLAVLAFLRAIGGRVEVAH